MSVSLALTLQRRLQNIVHLCRTTTAPDDSGTVQTVQMCPDDIRTFDAVPMVQQFGISSCPPIGSVAIRLCAGGDSGKGICIGTLHHASRPTGLMPGQFVFYDLAGSQIRLTNDGNIVLVPNGGKVTVQSDLLVTGKISADGEIIAQAGSAGAVHLSTHLHAGVQTGSGDTAQPIPGS